MIYLYLYSIIKITIKVKEDTKIEDAQKLSDIILKHLSDEQKKFYDISFYVTCEGENNLYPMIASKHKTKEAFSWTVKTIK